MQQFINKFKSLITLLTINDYPHLLNILMYRVQKKVIQSKVLNPYPLTELELGTYRTKCVYTRKELYARKREGYTCLHPEYNIYETCIFADRFVYEVEDVVVDTFTGHVFDNTGSLILESSSWPMHWHMSARTPGVDSKPVSRKHLKYEQVNSILLPQNGFFDWIHDDLSPFIFLMQNRPKSKILVYKKAPKYVLSFLNDYNIEHKFVDRYIKLDKYEFVAKLDNNWTDTTDIKIIRDFFLSAGVEPIAKVATKIFISRLKSNRSPSFESKLCDWLEQRGWKIIHAQDLTLMDQIRELRYADVIAGVHGAGLVGAIWSKPDCSLIEISNLNWRNSPILARLSAALGIKYKRIQYSEDDSKSLMKITDYLESII